MSTDYEIRCTCGTEFEHRYTRDNWRRPEEVNVLLSMREEFASISKKAAAASKAAKYGWSGPDGWNEGMFPSIFDFFAAHEGHEMHIFNEYGRRWPECPDGQHNMERKWADYASCRKCEFDDFTPGHPVKP